MSQPRVLVACVGNIFFGDDAFGVEVARDLCRRAQPEGVRVVDFGIRSIDLTYALLDGYEAVILVDAVPRGGPPGTLYVINPDLQESIDPESAGIVETHGMDPVKVLRLASAYGGHVERLLVVGCEPMTPRDADEMQAGLSEPVRAAVGEAVVLIESLVGRLLQGESIEALGNQSAPETEVQTCRD
jgi:hydrogenase maturation protease